MEEDIKRFEITRRNRGAIGFTEDAESLVIPEFFIGDGKNETEKGQKYQVTAIRTGSFRKAKLKSVFMPDSIRLIENSAFASCLNLQAIRLSNNLVRIDRYAFSFCQKLSSVYIPQNVLFLGEDVFLSCKNLKTIEVDSQNSYYQDICKQSVLVNRRNKNILWISALSSEIIFPEGIKRLVFAVSPNTTESGFRHKIFVIPDSVEYVHPLFFSRYESPIIIINKQENPFLGEPWGCKKAHIYWIG